MAAPLPFEPGELPSGAIANNQLHWLLAAFEPSEARGGRVLALAVVARIAWPDASLREVERLTRIDRRYLRRAAVVSRWMPRPVPEGGWLRIEREWLAAPVPAAARFVLFALRASAVDGRSGAWLPGKTTGADLYRRCFPREFFWYAPSLGARVFRRAVQQLRKAGYLDGEGLRGSGRGWGKVVRSGGGRLSESGGRLSARVINNAFSNGERAASGPPVSHQPPLSSEEREALRAKLLGGGYSKRSA